MEQATLNAIRKWISVKATMAMLEKQLEEIRPTIEAAAAFELGSNTGHFEGEGYKFTVSRRFNESWDTTAIVFDPHALVNAGVGRAEDATGDNCSGCSRRTSARTGNSIASWSTRPSS